MEMVGETPPGTESPGNCSLAYPGRPTAGPHKLRCPIRNGMDSAPSMRRPWELYPRREQAAGSPGKEQGSPSGGR